MKALAYIRRKAFITKLNIEAYADEFDAVILWVRDILIVVFIILILIITCSFDWGNS